MSVRVYVLTARACGLHRHLVGVDGLTIERFRAEPTPDRQAAIIYATGHGELTSRQARDAFERALLNARAYAVKVIGCARMQAVEDQAAALVSQMWEAP